MPVPGGGSTAPKLTQTLPAFEVQGLWGLGRRIHGHKRLGHREGPGEEPEGGN